MPKKPKLPPAPTKDAAELLVAELVDKETLPPRRFELLNQLKESAIPPGGANVVWDQLKRSRKPFGSEAGLKMLIVSLEGVRPEAGGEPDRSAIEPAAQLLAFFCNFKQYVKTIVNLKQLTKNLFDVLGNWESSEAARVSATWVLRRATEFSTAARMELVTNKEMLTLFIRVMKSDDLKPKAMMESLDTFVAIDSSRTSTPHSTPMGLTRKASTVSSVKSAVKLGAQQSQPKAVAPDGIPVGTNDPTSIWHNFDRTDENASGEAVREYIIHGKRALVGSQDSTWHPRSNNLLPTTQPSFSSFVERTRSSRPTTAVTYADEISRPTTANPRPGTSATMFSMTGHIQPDAMCMEVNCCAAIGNAAMQDECLERLGKNEGVIMSIIQMLESNSTWARGHAARTLGNILTSADNLKLLAAIDTCNRAAYALHRMVLDDFSMPRDRDHALHAIGNMVRSAVFYPVFNKQLEGFTSTLVRLAESKRDVTALKPDEQPRSHESIRRIIGALSQQRLGTRTWRQATRFLN